MATELALHSVRAPAGAVPDAKPHEWRGVAVHRDAVLRFLGPLCRDPHEAEDLAHETLLRAARFRVGLVDERRLRSWLVQIASNVRRDHLRREDRYQVLPPDDVTFCELESRDPVPVTGDARRVRVGTGQHAEDEVLAAVEAVFARLVPRDRAVLRTFYSDEGGAAEAADAAGSPRALVKVHLYRARHRLARRVEEELARRAVRRAEATVHACIGRRDGTGGG